MSTVFQRMSSALLRGVGFACTSARGGTKQFQALVRSPMQLQQRSFVIFTLKPKLQMQPNQHQQALRSKFNTTPTPSNNTSFRSSRRNLSSSKDVVPTNELPKTESVIGANYIGNTVYVTPFYKFVLVITGKYLPHKVPKRVTSGSLTSAFSRFRIMVGTLLMYISFRVAEVAIQEGKRARDGGEECLYDSVSARKIQAEKRQYARDYVVQKERYEKKLRDEAETGSAIDAK
eukprot:m.135524 g.135524  ORF g.135524 m.135524 type:complete len:232 (+) comp10063_c0_seq1:32-727(+)